MAAQRGSELDGDRVPASFMDEAGRLRAFVPPFRFASFFSPEDTLLCACAAEAALSHARIPRTPMRIAELTTGSGLVGLYLLMLERGSRLVGLDVDPVAINVAAGNAHALKLAGRARFECADLWADSTVDTLRRYQPQLLVCNPPYVPEPPGETLEMEAGAGHDGIAHIQRTLDIARVIEPRTIALSWCSLSDPARVMQEAEVAGYELDSLFVVAIADGEYSGSVRDYLRTLSRAYINEDVDTVNLVAPDGSARFAYLLMAGNFSRVDRRKARKGEASAAVGRICEQFASDGVAALRRPIAPVPVRTWLLDRWDELRLRVLLHGKVETNALVPG